MRPKRSTLIEHALVSHPWVAEAAVVGANDEITGQAVVAFVIVRSDVGDVTTLADSSVIDAIRSGLAEGNAD